MWVVVSTWIWHIHGYRSQVSKSHPKRVAPGSQRSAHLQAWGPSRAPALRSSPNCHRSRFSPLLLPFWFSLSSPRPLLWAPEAELGACPVHSHWILCCLHDHCLILAVHESGLFQGQNVSRFSLNPQQLTQYKVCLEISHGLHGT